VHKALQIGMVLGFIMATLPRLLSEPIGWGLYFGSVAIMMALGSRAVRQRMGLRLTANSFRYGATLCGTIAALSFAGVSWQELATDYWFFVAPLILVLPTLLWVDRRRHPAEFARWRAHQETCALRDVFLLRHIPDWRAVGEPRTKC
jgi:hypothetical protein